MIIDSAPIPQGNPYPAQYTGAKLKLRIEAQDPDTFLSHQLSLSPDTFCAAVRKVRQRLQKPPYTTAQYLTILTRQRLMATVAEREQISELI
jgi:hypothetical protein